MSTRTRTKQKSQSMEPTRADKGYEEVAERIFRDDTPPEPLFAILESECTDDDLDARAA